MKCLFALCSKNVNIHLHQPIDNIESGAECIFIQISPRIGVKLFYNNKYAAQRSAYRQNKASKFLLGPRVLSPIHKYSMIIERNNLIYLDRKDRISAGSIFGKDSWHCNYPRDNKFIFYGYKTQIAKMYNSKFKKTEGKIRSLKLALNSIVFKRDGFGDLVAGNNCGWIGKNLVAVDFGDFSV